MTFDADLFRSYFPALSNAVVYLDSAATALKPQVLSEAISRYYLSDTSTILRSQHHLALNNTNKIELARIKTAKLINATSKDEIIWTRGATESLNMIAYSYALPTLDSKSEIIVSELEHHSNLVPWQHISKLTGAKIVKWPVSLNGNLEISQLQKLLGPQTKIVAVTQMSNVSGYQPDLKQISHLAHQFDAKIVVDGAQGIVHKAIDVQEMNIDFYAFSCHKFYGPTGLGVLYGKKELLEEMDIWLGGGKMIEHVTFNDYIPASIPNKFEAGTPNVAGIIGFAETLDFVSQVDLKSAENYTIELADYLCKKLQSMPYCKIYSVKHSPVISFNIDGIHHYDIATLLAEQNIAIRSGELCASPFIKMLGTNGVIRVSLMPYNNKNDVDKFILALQNTIDILG